MPEMKIEHATFERLQRHARPLIDSVDMVVNRALDALEGERVRPPKKTTQPVDHDVEPDRLPDLTHTKLLTARLAGGEVAKPNWNRLLHLALVMAMRDMRDVDELRRWCPANMVAGQKMDDGYHYLPEADISVQGLSANEACGALTVTARGLGIAVDIVFLWRAKEGAAYPGKRGRLKITPR